jgi:hypothetical protein
VRHKTLSCKYAVLAAINLKIISCWLCKKLNGVAFQNKVKILFLSLHSRYSDKDTGWRVQVSNSGKAKKLLSSPKWPNHLWDLHSLRFNRNGDFPELNQLGRHVNHSLPSSFEIKIEWNSKSAPLYDLMSCREKSVTSDRHVCPWRDSIPQSEQTSNSKPTP